MKGKTSNNFIIFVNQRRSILAKFHALFWRIFKNVKLSNYLVVYFFFEKSKESLSIHWFNFLNLFSVFAVFLLGFTAPAVFAKKWKNGVADPSCYQVKIILYFYFIIYRLNMEFHASLFILYCWLVLFGLACYDNAVGWILEGNNGGMVILVALRTTFQILALSRGPIVF